MLLFRTISLGCLIEGWVGHFGVIFPKIFRKMKNLEVFQENIIKSNPFQNEANNEFLHVKENVVI